MATTRPTGGSNELDPMNPVTTGDQPPPKIEVTPLPLPVDVKFGGAATGMTIDQPLWVAIRGGARALSFGAYKAFIDHVLCAPTPTTDDEKTKKSKINARVTAPLVESRFFGTDAYQLLRAATEVFVLTQSGVVIPSDYNPVEERGRFGGTAPTLEAIKADLTLYLTSGTLPYIDRIVGAFGKDDYSPLCSDLPISIKVASPLFLELIWSYWQEEGSLVQSMNALTLRFQNKRGPGDRDPLANFETNPLRPLSNLLWGYIEDDDHRLTVARRAYEYHHHYGLSLIGRAVPRLRPAETRSKFLAAFHTLLHNAAVFYDRAANLTVRADGFPLLTSLREVHLLLAEGAHNQYRDLPWTARMEMLMMQWLLSRSEIREFLGARSSIPYTEPWMGPVDNLKRLMGWTDTPVTHFHDLAVDGEQIVLSVRFGDWSVVNDDEQARSWAQYWRPEIQRYIHDYHAVTGIDLAATSQDRQLGLQINATQPSVLLQERLAQQRAAKG